MNSEIYLSYITPSSEITDKQEFQNELIRLLESAHRNDVPLGPVSTWVCRYNQIPDQEGMITELAD